MHLSKNLKWLYAFIFLFITVKTFFKAYLGIYLYFLGVPVEAIILFVVIHSIMHGTLSIPVGKLTVKRGFKTPIAASLVLFLVALVMILQFEKSLDLFWVAAVVWGAHSGLMWVPLNSFFTYVTNRHDRPEQEALSQVMSMLASAFFGLASALLITFWGASSILIFALIVSIFLFVPLYFFNENHIKLKDFDISYLKQCNENALLAQAAFGVGHIARRTIWPIIIFLIAGTIQIASYVLAITFTAKLFVAWVVGKITVKKGKKPVFVFGYIGEILAWLGRLVVTTTGLVILVDLFYEFVKIPYQVAHDAKVDDVSEDSKNVVAFTSFYETAIHLGIVVGGLISLGMLWMGVDLRLLLILGLLEVALSLILFKPPHRKHRHIPHPHALSRR